MGTRIQGSKRRESGKVSPGCLIAVVVALVVVGVGGYFLWQAGLDLIGGQVQEKLANHPVIVEHLGVLDACEIDLDGSEKLGKEDWCVFDARGPKGKGYLKVRLDPKDGDDIVKEASLELEDGRTFELPLEGEESSAPAAGS